VIHATERTTAHGSRSRGRSACDQLTCQVSVPAEQEAKPWYDFDFDGAERSFERVIELNPRHPIAHSWFGYYLGLVGRDEEAYTKDRACSRTQFLPGISVNWLTQLRIRMCAELLPSFVTRIAFCDLPPDGLS